MTLFTSSLCFAPSVVGVSSVQDPLREDRMSRQQVSRFLSYSTATWKHNASLQGIYCIAKDILSLDSEAKSRLDWQSNFISLNQLEKLLIICYKTFNSLVTGIQQGDFVSRVLLQNAGFKNTNHAHTKVKGIKYYISHSVSPNNISHLR